MTNRLAAETSPYLLQHADNPVDWYPWGEEALALARKTGKPILLSVGYSACHWCHVMAHESFEDESTARLMNSLFVNIKVDREERPDIDRIYQTAHQLLTQRPGGWPLTMFIDPDSQRPFFGGTYFPREARYGMPAFGELLRHVADYFANNPDEVRSQGEQLDSILRQLEPQPAEQSDVLNGAPLQGARDRLAASFDRDYGGFGGAPKFPHPTNIDRLLRHWRDSAHSESPDVEALFMATLTLTRMAEGGIYDQVGGGFCRYSVDRYWQIPHFEKMLYDNGPLLALYAQAYSATGDPLFRRVALETGRWICRDMRAENGGFFSSLDADSEGEEGRFYVWTPEELQAILEKDDYELAARRFGLDQAANFEGKWHLVVRTSLEELAKQSGNSAEQVAKKLDVVRETIRKVREQRVAPGLDDKQLTAWNAMAVRGLAIAGRALDNAEFSAAAESGARFLADALIRDGRLFASYKNGDARFPAYLDDHAFLLDALLEVLQTRWDSKLMQLAIDLADTLLDRFADPAGGFYFTSDSHETLMSRPKPLADEAMPSGNGVAAFALQRLGYLLGESRYLLAAEQGLRGAWRAMQEYPHGHVSLITALEEYLEPPEIIVIRGPRQEIDRWRHSASAIYAPRRLVFAIENTAEGLPGALADRAARENETVAYRCVGQQCSLPITTWEALAADLQESGRD